jgi:hypothetical protein
MAVDLVHLNKHRDRSRAFVNTVMNVRVSKRWGKVLTS